MASTRQLTRLFDALRAHDIDTARSVADEIANDTERRGHTTAARALRTALRAQGHVLRSPLPELVTAPEALARVAADKSLADVQLTRALRAELETLATETRFAMELAELGIPRRTKLLLSGPPGCGKSVTARGLALSLGLPVYVVRIDGIIGSLLGQTSGRVHDVFRFAERTPCVLLLDELDAIGRRRGERHDVAELDRVVVGLMQELDYTQVPGLVVATTNFIEAVDPALARRFDAQFTLALPDRDNLRSYLVAKCRALRCRVSADRLLAELPDGASYADAERLLFDAVRATALEKLTKARIDERDPG